jgi:TetR/AcrR family transcriptional repressor of bet genes
MNAAYGYTIEPARAARMLRIMIEGLWLEMMTLLDPYSQEEAKKTAWTCASLLYPRHFGPDGLLRPEAGTPQ